MSTFLKILCGLIIVAIAVGFYFRWNDNVILGDRIIGLSVLASAFILLPLFLYHSWKGKKFEDYTLTDKNIKKMKERNKNNRR